MFGQPATLRLSTQPDGTVLTQLDGRMGAPALGAFIPEASRGAWRAAPTGRRAWSRGAEGTELRIESDLQGLAIGLPEPFAKRADESRALAVTIRKLGADDEETVAALEGGVHARIGRDRRRRRRALERGAQVRRPGRRRSRFATGSGSTATSRASTWTPGGRRSRRRPRRAPADAPAALELRGLDLRFGTLRYTGRDVREPRGPPAARRRRVARDAREPARRGRRGLRLPGPGPHPGAPRALLARDGGHGRGGPGARAAGRAGRPAGARHRGRALRVPRPLAGPARAPRQARRRGLAHRPPRHRERSTRTSRPPGVSRRTATGPLTQLDLKLETTNLHALLEQFGYGDFVNRGEAKLEGQLVWPGFAYEFAPGALSGRLQGGGLEGAVREDRAGRRQAPGPPLAAVDPAAGDLRLPRRLQRGLRLRPHLGRGEARARHPPHRGLRDRRARRPS